MRPALLLLLVVVGMVSCSLAVAAPCQWATRQAFDGGGELTWTASTYTVPDAETSFCGAWSANPPGTGWTALTCTQESFGWKIYFVTPSGYYNHYETTAIPACAAPEPEPPAACDPETTFCASDMVSLCWMVIGCWAAAFTLRLLAFAARPS